jgi:DNA (cytosine-5)-methyltransferase 1
VQKHRVYKAIDLFAGAGGLTLGLKLAGLKVIGAVEVNPLAAETYVVNHPEVLMWHCDIQDLDPEFVMRMLALGRGELDLLAGCPPCQGFSPIRTLNSGAVDDPRNDLVFDMLNFIEVFEPRVIMMENTPALAQDWRMTSFWSKLTALGYQGDYPIRDAADFGVPQRRKRMLLLAGRNGRVTFPSPAQEKLTVEDTIGDLPVAGTSGDPLHDTGEKHTAKVVKRISRIPKDGGSRSALGDDQLACHKKCSGFKDVYGRIAWKSQAPTITGGCFNPSKGRFLHPDENRAITLREAALLQSFPPDYFFSLRKGKCCAAELIGNALPPEFIRQHGVSIVKYLKRHDRGGQHA